MSTKGLAVGSDYHPREEFLNALLHGLGVVFGIVALVLMLVKAVGSSASFSGFQITGLALYGASLIVMFLSSTLYHSLSNTRAKSVLKRLDHCAIFALIAGTYTPILLIGLATSKALVLFWVLWGIALTGIVFKVFFVHRFDRASLLAYLGMGWLSVLIIKDMLHALDPAALVLIVLGGVLYTVGTIFYAAKNRRYTHAIWHLFVLGAAVCHALAIGLYVVK